MSLELISLFLGRALCSTLSLALAEIGLTTHNIIDGCRWFVVPVESELQDNNAVENNWEDILELEEEVVGLEKHSAQASDHSHEGEQECEESELPSWLITVVSDDLGNSWK